MDWKAIEEHFGGGQSNVYLLKCVDSAGKAFYKVGIADDIQERIDQLQTGNPFPIEPVTSYAAPRAVCREVESWLHDVLTLEGYHARGEWFALPEDRAEELKKTFQFNDPAFKSLYSDRW